MDILQYLNDIVDFFKLPIWRYLIYGVIFLLVIIWLAFVFWTYRDAKLRNTQPIFWAFVVLLFNFVGLILYLILRPPEYYDDIIERDLEIQRMEMLLGLDTVKCPACAREVKEEYLICPYCRKKLKSSCVSCQKPLNLDWKICPYCKASQ